MRKIALFGPVLILIIALYMVGVRIYQNRSANIVVPTYVSDYKTSSADDEENKSEEEENKDLEDITDKININTANESELQLLDGIGKTLSQRIVQKRNELGGFSSVDQLLELDGVGEKLFSDIEMYIICE